MGIQVKQNNTYVIEVLGVNNFNLVQIANSGQCFRWKPIDFDLLTYGTVGYWIVANGRLLRIEQGVDMELYLWCTESEFYECWQNYFDLDTNYQQFIDAVKGDIFLEQAVDYGSGIRILNQNAVETIISFMLSSANNIPRIQSLVDKLCIAYGTKIASLEHGMTYYTFPSIEQLSKATEQEFRELGMGFRAANIYKFIQSLYQNDPISMEENERIRTLWHIFQNIDPNIKLHSLLTSITGIGDKIASCIELFAYHDLDAFPIDVWVDRILFNEYGGGEVGSISESKRKKCRDMILDRHFCKYAGFRGVIQQYMFYYYRNTH